jgi:Arm DNA-binding domain
MRRSIHKLSARAVATLTKPGRHSDGGGLYLFISKDNKALRRRWVFRFTWRGKAIEMGLGSATQTSLAEARAKASEARREVAAKHAKPPVRPGKAARPLAIARRLFLPRNPMNGGTPSTGRSGA